MLLLFTQLNNTMIRLIFIILIEIISLTLGHHMDLNTNLYQDTLDHLTQFDEMKDCLVINDLNIGLSNELQSQLLINSSQLSFDSSNNPFIGCFSVTFIHI